MLLDTNNIFHELQANGEDVGTEENETPTDYTAGDNTGAEETDAPEEAAEGPEENPEDYTVPDDATEDPEGGDEPPQEGEGDPEEGEGDVEGEEGGDPSSEETQEPNPYDSQIAELEKDIYGDLTDQQFTIRDRELKSNFSKLYDDVDEIINRINDMSKSEELLKPLEFVADQLSELRERVSDYLNYTYNTKTYTENVVNFNLFLDVMSKINSMLEKLHK